MSQNKLLKKLSELLGLDKKERKKRVMELHELLKAERDKINCQMCQAAAGR